MYVILMLGAKVTLLGGLTCLIRWHIYFSIKKLSRQNSPVRGGGAGSIAVQGSNDLNFLILRP